MRDNTITNKCFLACGFLPTETFALMLCSRGAIFCWHRCFLGSFSGLQSCKWLQQEHPYVDQDEISCKAQKKQLDVAFGGASFQLPATHRFDGLNHSCGTNHLS